MLHGSVELQVWSLLTQACPRLLRVPVPLDDQNNARLNAGSKLRALRNLVLSGAISGLRQELVCQEEEVPSEPQRFQAVVHHLHSTHVSSNGTFSCKHMTISNAGLSTVAAAR